MEPSIYQYPDIFRRVHMERPGEIAEEVRFLRRVWRRHYPRPVRRILDVACGNSPHGQLLARGAVQVVGIDRSSTMIAAGRRESRALKNIRFYRRPIERFHISERPFDVAFFMSETFPVIQTNGALISHLRSVGQLLHHGGLYCVDIDRQDPLGAFRRRRLWRSRVVRIGPKRVRVREFNRPTPWYSGVQRIYELECRFGDGGRTVITRDLIPIRHTLPCWLELAARASGAFQLDAFYTDLSFTASLDKCDRRWLGVLRRV
jgi:SAM-dependent methyltransferase